jgi:DNA-directed RNA polymerase I, II, and III subunit RPABC2
MAEKYDDDDYSEEEEEENETKPKSNKKADEPSDIDDSDNESKASSGEEDDDDDQASDIGSDDEEARNNAIFKKDKEKDANAQQYELGDADNDDDDDEDEDEYDENYLQKFDENLKQNIISEYHPEMQQLNYSEVELLTVVRRNEDGEIYDPLHRTLPFLTKFEKARILGERAKQINDGAKPMISITTNAIDGYLIALAELEQKVIPFIIKRPLPNGGCEYWKVKDLEVLM